MRDYGTADWEGGIETCDHDNRRQDQKAKQSTNGGSCRESLAGSRFCKKCGAVRVDKQIGLEPTPEEFVQAMVEVFREVRRVLRDDGVAWINLGDSYVNSGSSRNGEGLDGKRRGGYEGPEGGTGYKKRDIRNKGLATGNLLGIPWRVALALQADGWVLRQDVIWAKKSPMPEPVESRCTKAHEYIFMLTKGMDYYFDAVAIREKSVTGEWNSAKSSFAKPRKNLAGMSEREKQLQRTQFAYETHHPDEVRNDRNKRSVWTLPTGSGFKGSHYATFPLSLPLTCIKASTSWRGCCAKCGSPHERVMDKTKRKRNRPNWLTKREYEGGTGNACPNDVDGVDVKTLGWEATCSCDADVTSCTVLDPFGGVMTTGLACQRLGRKFIGIELSLKYLKMGKIRLETRGRTAEVKSMGESRSGMVY